MVKKDVELFKSIVKEVVAEELKPIESKLNAMEKQLNALSVDNSVVVEKEAPVNVAKTPEKPKKKSGTTKKSEKKPETPEYIKRLHLQSNRRLETEEFKQVYALVKKHNGKIKNNENKDKDGKRLPLWTFSVDDGKAMVDEVNANVKSIFGRKKMPLEYKIVQVEIKK